MQAVGFPNTHHNPQGFSRNRSRIWTPGRAMRIGAKLKTCFLASGRHPRQNMVTHLPPDTVDLEVDVTFSKAKAAEQRHKAGQRSLSCSSPECRTASHFHGLLSKSYVSLWTGIYLSKSPYGRGKHLKSIPVFLTCLCRISGPISEFHSLFCTFPETQNKLRSCRHLRPGKNYPA